MDISLYQEWRVVVQGISGKFASRHVRISVECGTNIVAGVTPGKGGRYFDEKIPIFDTVEDAVKATGANASLIFVPPMFAPDAIMEAIDEGIELIVCITEGIALHEMLKIKQIIANSRSILVGPNSPGIAIPLEDKKVIRLGIIPPHILRPGCVGIVSRSGTLTYETAWQLTQRGLGQSLCIGIGGDAIRGISMLDVVRFLHEDRKTELIVVIGEIGGIEEEQIASWYKRYGTKPLVAHIVGKNMPIGVAIGHAGAVTFENFGRADDKIATLREAGAIIVDSLAEMGKTVFEILNGR